MINLFITYRCNLACDYCFARELGDTYPDDMQAGTFQKLLRWMKACSLPSVGFIGGEPSLHAGLAGMVAAVKDAGIAPVLFSNGLFVSDLADRLCGRVSNFVINYNNPARYTAGQRSKLHKTLSRLSERGARITFSKNFSPDSLDYEYFLEGVERYAVRAVRYDLSRPARSAANDHFPLNAMQPVWDHIVSFVRECESLGVRTGLDCCARLCELSADQRRYIESVSMKFSGICHPSMDIHPDLSASYCLPLHDVRVPDVTAFTDNFSLMAHFAEMVRTRRFEDVGPDCLRCTEFKRTCQGGCLAAKRHAAAQIFPYAYSEMSSINYETI